jgi:hypothetical protein
MIILEEALQEEMTVRILMALQEEIGVTFLVEAIQ